MEKAPSPEEMAERLKYEAVVPKPPKREWPTWEQVGRDFPNACEEEHQWILEALLAEAWEQRRAEEREKRESDYQL